MYHTQINGVLQVSSNTSLSTLSKECRTLLKTLQIADPTLYIAGSKYLHLRVEAGILSILQQTSSELILLDTLIIDFSSDNATLDR